MSDNVREKAKQDLALVEEVSAVVLPEPRQAQEIVSLEQADPTVSSEIRQRMDEIDMDDTNSIVAFRIGGPGRASGNLSGDVAGRAQQGRGAGRRLAALYRDHDPRLFGVGA